MKARKMAILLTAGVGLSIMVGQGVAGTYIYRDESGNEVRKLPRPEPKSREAKVERGGSGTKSGRRSAGKSPASVIVDSSENPSNRAQR